MARNLVARRTEDESCSCCGCGKICKVLYEVLGRYDFSQFHTQFESVYLCYRCFRPFMKLIDVVDPPKKEL